MGPGACGEDWFVGGCLRCMWELLAIYAVGLDDRMGGEHVARPAVSTRHRLPGISIPPDVSDSRGSERRHRDRSFSRRSVPLRDGIMPNTPTGTRLLQFVG